MILLRTILLFKDITKKKKKEKTEYTCIRFLQGKYEKIHRLHIICFIFIIYCGLYSYI